MKCLFLEQGETKGPFVNSVKPIWTIFDTPQWSEREETAQYACNGWNGQLPLARLKFVVPV